MKELIHSEVDGSLLHVVYRLEDLSSQMDKRINFGEECDFLQVAAIRSPAKTEYAPHAHLTRSRKLDNLKAQESWVVVSGSVEVQYYDIDDRFIASRQLNRGDLTITFNGGHGYKILGEETLVYEFKSGPYEGVEIDKRFIE